MSPSVLISAVCMVLFTAYSAAIGYFAYGAGVDAEIANRRAEDQVRAQTKQDAMVGTAKAIAELDIKHETIVQPLRTEVDKEIVYRDCVHTPTGLRSLNDVLTDGPVSDSKLPEALAPSGQGHVR